jgi:hypothetical protein
MPELFGSMYVLPAIIVVVLLAVLIVALLLSKRGKAAGATNERRMSASKVTSPEGLEHVEPVTAAAQEAGAVPANAAEGAKAMKPAPKAPSRPAKEWGSVGPAADRTEHDDPLGALLTQLMRGWGGLSSEDTRRLSLFRSEKLQAAIQALKLPKDLRDDHDARARLDQLVRYAANLGTSSKHAPPVHTEADAETPATPAMEALSQAAAAKRETAAETATAPSETPAETAPLKEIAASTERAETSALLPDEPVAADMIEATAVVAAPQLSWGAATTWEEVTSPTLEQVEADSGWSSITETPAATETIPAIEASAAEGAPAASAAETSAEAVAAGWAGAFAAGAVSPATPGTSANRSISNALDDTVEIQPPRLPFLGGMVKSADDLLALPKEEQADMVAFLQPSELAGVLAHTTDLDLKRAIIDTLEHVNTPASLDVLRQCLEDPDPAIQTYALQAADRILGAG